MKKVADINLRKTLLILVVGIIFWNWPVPEGLTERNIGITTGAAEGLALAFRCFAHHKTVGLPRGYWENYENGVDMACGRAVIVDFFDASGRLDIQGLERVSKPGRRVYCGKDDVPAVLNGLGIAIVSTSQGVLTDRRCRELGVGGEVICRVW